MLFWIKKALSFPRRRESSCAVSTALIKQEDQREALILTIASLMPRRRAALDSRFHGNDVKGWTGVNFLSPRKNSQSGFTLIELMVAVTVLGLLMSLLYANIQSGTKAWVQGQAHVANTGKTQSVQLYLQKQISRIYPKFLPASETGARIDFDGSRDVMQFISPMADALGGGGVAKTTLSIIQSGDYFQLVMTQHPELAWDDNPEASRTVLIKKLKFAAFSYFGSDTLWHDDWSNKQELPKLIKIRAEYADGKKFWPELVVAPRIDVDVGCIYDPLTKYCQGR